LFCEFEIRREVDRLETVSAPPLKKARKFLRLARAVRAQAATLARLSAALMQDCYGEQAARMHDSAARLLGFHEEIRSKARGCLGSSASASIYNPLRADGLPALEVAHEFTLN
jgi:hypothetical protein